MAAYFCLLLVHPFAPLLIIPTIVTTFDLTPWLGWALFNELDLFLLVSIAGVSLRTSSLSSIRAKYSRKFYLIIGTWCAAWLLAFISASGSVDNLTLRPNGVFYFSEAYQLFQLKGPIYALLLWIMWKRLNAVDSPKAVNSLFYGAMFAGLVLFGVITWERGVWQDLLSPGAYYYRLASLLDFTSRYRVTGSLSAMHTGGEAIDGSIILLIALVTGGIFHFKESARWLFIVAAIALLYCLITTFTRTTYAALIIMLLMGGALGVKRGSLSAASNRGKLLLGAFVVIGTMLCLLQIYRASGYLGLVAGYAIIGLGLLNSAFSPIRHINRWILATFYCVAIALGLYAQLSSKWVTAGPKEILIHFIILVALSSASHTLSRFVKLSRTAIMSILVIGLAGSFFMLTLFASYRMTERLTNVGSDFQTRFDHWSDVLDARSGDWRTVLLGMGPGTYPLAYATSYPEKVRKVGSFTLDKEGLTLGFGKDLKIAQRIKILPHHNYEIVINASTKEPSQIAIGFCERNFLFASESPGNCAHTYKDLPASDKQQLRFSINSESVGKNSIIGRWPTIFYFSNQKQTTFNIEFIQVLLDGSDVIKNGNFKGNNYWYFYNDFKHLPWHMKNIPLALFFELGLFGLLSTLLLIFYSFSSAVKKAREGSSVALAGVMSIVGILSVGMMGNPLDSARVSLLFYWIVLIFSENDKHIKYIISHKTNSNNN